MTLFERLGGTAEVMNLVNELTVKIAASAILAPYFAHISGGMKTTALTLMLTYATDGLPVLPGNKIRSAHSPLHLGLREYETMVGLVIQVLSKRDGVTEADLAAVTVKLNVHRPNIVA